jgi:hypothetical protein
MEFQLRTVELSLSNGRSMTSLLHDTLQFDPPVNRGIGVILRIVSVALRCATEWIAHSSARFLHTGSTGKPFSACE